VRFKKSWLHQALCFPLAILFSNVCLAQMPPQTPAWPPAGETSRKQSEIPAGMVRIKGGEFQMGIDRAEVPRYHRYFGVNTPALFEPETPRHSIKLASFFLDRNLVTNAEFFGFTRRFPDEDPSEKLAKLDQPFTEFDPRSRYGDRKNLKHWVDGQVPKGLENHPVTNVTWYDAVAYCQWLGKRLPTEAEWEYAARGGGNPIFPWGDAAADPSRANYSASGHGTTTSIGTYAPNGYGLYDMAGNVWQFTADEWAPYSSSPKPAKNPVSGGDLFSTGFSFLSVTTRRVIRGGSWGGAPVNLWVEYRDSHPPDGAQPFVGFRCAKSPD
jgi:formylglycine-generating enzyme required for sulfatase activity